MGQEIERKYFVKRGWPIGSCDKAIKIRQGYLAYEDSERVVRVRLSESECEKHAFLTVKGLNCGISRPEFEYGIPYDDGIELLNMCKVEISKTRHLYVADKHLFEIDVFHGKLNGLVLAEVELDHESDKVLLPDWIGKDVSSDMRYTNSHLASELADDGEYYINDLIRESM